MLASQLYIYPHLLESETDQNHRLDSYPYERLEKILLYKLSHYIARKRTLHFLKQYAASFDIN